MDKLEDFFPRLLGYLTDDLSKENLTSKAEKDRLDMIRLTEKLFQDSVAKKITAKYDNPQVVDVSAVQRRTSLLRGSILPSLFNRSSMEVKVNDSNNNSATKSTDKNQNAMVAYEEPSGYEMPVGNIYEEVVLHKLSQDTSCNRPPLNRPSNPPPNPPSNPPPNALAYEDASNFAFGTERIAEASNSDSGTDYEDYGNEDEKLSCKGNADSINGKSKINEKVGRERIERSSLRYSGCLYQKGSFNQYHRRFCGIRGGTFVCCKSGSSLKVVLEVVLSEYETVHQEKRDSKSNYSQELRFSCPGKETHLFYTDSKQDAENWVKELRKSSVVKQDSFDTNSEDMRSLTDYNDSQSENSESNISGGSVDRNCIAKILNQQPQQTDEARKKSKLQSFLGTVGKKLGNKTKNALQQAVDFSIPQHKDGKTENGYLSIRSEEYTGDRWFKRFCRIEDGHLNFYRDHVTESRPEFSLSLRGAQLKPHGDKDELKITIVQNKMEHCLKMDDFLDHGMWLGSFIRETGFARQLIGASKQTTKDSRDAPLLPVDSTAAGIYEQPNQLFGLDDVTLDESFFPDDAPPPLPDYSPPPSPSLSEILLGEKKTGGGGEGGGGGGIYLEPAEWLMDLEEIKNQKKPKKNKNEVKISPEQEESLYINRDFLVAEKKPSKDKEKPSHKDKSPMVASNSFPSLVSVGLTEVKRRGEVVKGKSGEAIKRDDVTSGKRDQRLRPSSVLVESLESSKETKVDEKKIREEKQTNKKLDTCLLDKTKEDSRTKKDSAQASVPYQEKQSDGCKVKSSQSYRDIIGKDMTKINRSNRANSVSSEDLSSSRRANSDSETNKQMVQSLVKMFEQRT